MARFPCSNYKYDKMLQKGNFSFLFSISDKTLKKLKIMFAREGKCYANCKPIKHFYPVVNFSQQMMAEASFISATQVSLSSFPVLKPLMHIRKITHRVSFEDDTCSTILPLLFHFPHVINPSIGHLIIFNSVQTRPAFALIIHILLRKKPATYN